MPNIETISISNDDEEPTDPGNEKPIIANPTNTNNRNFKYSFTRSKKKYNKPLSVYERIDSNFNYIYTNKKYLLIDNKSEKSDSDTFSNNSNLSNSVDPPNTLPNKNKNIILIKGFYLIKTSSPQRFQTDPSILKISDLSENTINIIV